MHTVLCPCCWLLPRLQVTPLLAERFFGSALELTSHDNYCPFWESDAQDPTSRPAGSEDGESVVQVSQRVQQLFTVCAGSGCCWVDGRRQRQYTGTGVQ